MVDLWWRSVKEVLLYTKTSLNRLTMGPTLNGPLMEVLGFRELQYRYNDRWVIIWDPNKSDRYRGVVDLGRWLVREALLTLKPL